MPRAIIGVIALLLFTASLAAGSCNGTKTAAATGEAQTAQSVRSTPSAPLAVPSEAAEAVDTAGSAGVRTIILPAGTRLPIVLETTVGSDISHIEEPVHAHLARAINIRGVTVVPAGSRVSGIVTDATRSAKVKGRAHVVLRFDTLVPAGEDERYRIDTAAVGRTAPGTKKKDALEIGIPAAGGAVIGGLLGGKKGALIGTAAGGGAGTAVVLSTRGREIHLPRGAALTLRLVRPVAVRAR